VGLVVVVRDTKMLLVQMLQAITAVLELTTVVVVEQGVNQAQVELVATALFIFTTKSKK
jgi:hypothetical protein